ncbi:hypothetical protein FISHEDRAFT_73821 [Fistulina hepatica ATCC 64428]|uniref:Glyoxalase-like domain-containing protein n=1 Tax=Fistulina hepatica ATCC 64428 TaxID=1128425 RepID=A0A0D7ABM8_9AGAR|nr:hypothetical protein FISHEDRAFT_73821 [Fistulina hepatica ATCC 64428]
MVPTNILDHMVYMGLPGKLNQTIKKFQELGFRVIPGGTHADGLTENALVVLRDGVYIELICFTRPAEDYPPGSPDRARREGHRWASKSPGWIDFAFLGNGVMSPPENRISSTINERAARDGSGVSYLDEVPGGRTRADGKVLKWLITAPSSMPTPLPFFCGDVTPRELRVPAGNATHPGGVTGISFARLLVAEKEYVNLTSQISSVVGADPIDGKATWSIGSSGRSSHPQMLLTIPKDKAEGTHLKAHGAGLYEVAFSTESPQKIVSI